MEQLIMNAIKNYGIEKAMGMFAKDDVDEAVEKMTGGGFGNSFINKFTGGQGLTGLFKNQAKKFGVNQGLKALTGGSGIAGALPLFGAALGLGYMTNPLREGSYNYNPNLQGQLDYASRMGNLNRNNSAGALRYAGDSILSGQNAVSGFGTNDYMSQLEKYKDKYGDTMSPERLEKLNKEISAFQLDQVNKELATKTTTTTNNKGGSGDNGNDNIGGSNIGGSNIGGANEGNTSANKSDQSYSQHFAKGGDVPSRKTRLNDEVSKESGVKQFTPPPEKTGILQKLFGIDTDKLYDQGFDSMNKYRERNPDNPREVLQTAGGKLSNLRHGVSTSLLRDAILKKINPGSYEMKEAPPSMNFKELKMSEEGPNKAAKGVASLLAYLGAGSNEIGTDFFSQETMEDLTANLLGLMKTDVYDTPEDKAAMLNEILENDTGGINTYLQSLAPKEKYQEDASLFPPMRQDKMRDQDLLFMKAEEEYEDKVKNLGLGAMDG